MAISAGTVGVTLTANDVKLRMAMERAARSTERTSRRMQKSMSTASVVIHKAFRGVIALIGVRFAGQMANSAVQAALSMQRIERALKVATGSVSAAKKEFKFLAATSMKLGIDLEGAATMFGRLSAAALGTSLHGKGVRDIFLAMSKAAIVLGLSADQTTHALVAFEQIISKGRVQTEEVRRQLGNVLPGAFQIAARSIGVTTAALDKMLKLGQVLPEKLLPAMAREMEKTFGPQIPTAMKSLQASIGRLTTAWFLFKVALTEGGVLDALTDATNALAKFIKPTDNQRVDDFRKKIKELRDELDALGDSATAAQKIRMGFSFKTAELEAAKQELRDFIQESADAAREEFRLSFHPEPLDVEAEELAEKLKGAQDIANELRGAVQEIGNDQLNAHLQDIDAAQGRLTTLLDKVRELRFKGVIPEIITAYGEEAEDAFSKVNALVQADVPESGLSRSAQETVAEWKKAVANVKVLMLEQGEVRKSTLPVIPLSEKGFLSLEDIIAKDEKAYEKALDRFLKTFETKAQKLERMKAEFVRFKTPTIDLTTIDEEGLGGTFRRMLSPEQIEEFGAAIDEIARKPMQQFITQFETAADKAEKLRKRLKEFSTGEFAIPTEEVERIAALIDEIAASEATSFLKQFETSKEKAAELHKELEQIVKDGHKIDDISLARFHAEIDALGDADIRSFIGQFDTAKMKAAEVRKEWEKVRVAMEADIKIGKVDATEIERIGDAVGELVDDIENADLTAFLQQFETAEQTAAKLREQLELFKESIKPEEFERISKAIQRIALDTQKAWDQAVRNMQDALAEFFMFAESGFKGMVESFLQAIRRMLANQLAAEFFGFLKGIFKPKVPVPAPKGGGGGGGPRAFMGFHAGGSFTVPGSGGSDSVPIGFMATPGERVTITPANAVNAGGNITINNNIDASGADADRILALMPAIMQQTSDETVARIQALKQRGRF